MKIERKRPGKSCRYRLGNFPLPVCGALPPV